MHNVPMTKIFLITFIVLYTSINTTQLAIFTQICINKYKAKIGQIVNIFCLLALRYACYETQIY